MFIIFNLIILLLIDHDTAAQYFHLPLYNNELILAAAVPMSSLVFV